MSFVPKNLFDSARGGDFSFFSSATSSAGPAVTM